MGASLPLNLLVAGRRCVVLGARAVEDGKVQALASRGARVTVIAEAVTDEVAAAAQSDEVEWEPRAYRHGDLQGAFLVVSGHHDRVLDEAVWREAQERGVLINTVDDASRCTAIFPAIVRRGPLQVSVSTDGRSPAVAVRAKQRLEQEFGEEYAALLEILGDARPLLAGWRTLPERAQVWYEIVDSDVLDLIRAGRGGEARRRVIDHIRSKTGE